MNLRRDGIVSYSELSSQFQSLRGTLESVREKSNSNFSGLNRLLKVYFDDACCIGDNLDASFRLVGSSGSSRLQSTFSQELIDSASCSGSFIADLALSLSKISSLKKLITEGSKEFDLFLDETSIHVQEQHEDCWLGYQSQQAAFRRLNSLVEDIQGIVGALAVAFYGVDAMFAFAQGNAGSAVTVEPALLSGLDIDRKHCSSALSRLATGIQVHDALLQRLEHLDKIFERILEDIKNNARQEEGNGYSLVLPQLMRLAVMQMQSIKTETHVELDAISHSIKSIEEQLGRMVAAYVRMKCCEMSIDGDKALNLSRWVDSFADLAAYKQSIEVLVDNAFSEASVLMAMQANFRSRAARMLSMQSEAFGLLANEINAQKERLCNIETLLNGVVESVEGLRLKLDAITSEGGLDIDRLDNASEYLAAFLFDDGESSFCHKSLLCRNATSEEHRHFTKYFGKKISMLIDMERNLEMAIHASESQVGHFSRIMADVEKLYTMQGERAIHWRFCSGELSDFDDGDLKLEEFAGNEEGVELF